MRNRNTGQTQSAQVAFARVIPTPATARPTFNRTGRLAPGVTGPQSVTVQRIGAVPIPSEQLTAPDETEGLPVRRVGPVRFR